MVEVRTVEVVRPTSAVRFILSDHCSSFQRVLTFVPVYLLLIAALGGSGDTHRLRASTPPPPKFFFSRRGIAPRKFCEKSKDTYPSPRACKFVGKIEFVDQSLALSSNGSFARLNNSIRGTNTVPRKFTRNSVMKELVRRCIVR
jgi:hypothetical protein